MSEPSNAPGPGDQTGPSGAYGSGVAPKPPGRPGQVGRVILTVHRAVVLVLIVLYVVLTQTHPGPDANIGAGMVGLALLVLGLPWTAPFLAGAAGPDGTLGIVLRLGPAVLNVALHGFLRLIISPRR